MNILETFLNFKIDALNKILSNRDKITSFIFYAVMTISQRPVTSMVCSKLIFNLRKI